MDIFNGNRKLEQVAMYGIDWGMFIRHNIEETTIPFAWLFDGEEARANVLMTDENPFDYAFKLLQKEKRNWQQVVIGVEGFLKNQAGEKVDALIIQAFDLSQQKGISLGQMFVPKEKTGTFKKVDTPAFLGHIDLPFPTKERHELGYEGTKPGYTNMIMKDHSAALLAGHKNPSVVGNIFKMFIRSKFSSSPATVFTGKFHFNIFTYTPNNEFAKYTILNAINEERNAPASKAWEEETGKQILINVTHDETIWQRDYEADKIGNKAGQINSLGASNHEVEEAPKEVNAVKQSFVSSIDNPIDKSNTKSIKQKATKPWWKFW